MAELQAQSPQRLVLAYRPEGFQRVGGLLRIAQDIVSELHATHPCRSVTTLSSTSQGVLKGTLPCRKLRKGDQLLIVGCDCAWAYGLAVLARLRQLPVSWLPSFHNPAHAVHPSKAHLAQLVLKLLQNIGVAIYAQTAIEQSLLQSRFSPRCLLSGHGLPAKIRKMLLRGDLPNHGENRPIDLLFLGRPTLQKGWPTFIALARSTQLRCEAIVPTKVDEPDGITLHHCPTDNEVEQLLHQAKLVVIPANYESFGIAQLEAIAAGCVVPILGDWPLWDGFSVLQWQHLTADQLASHCEQLCNVSAQRQWLHQQQWGHLCRHPVVHTPILPGLA